MRRVSSISIIEIGIQNQDQHSNGVLQNLFNQSMK